MTTRMYCALADDYAVKHRIGAPVSTVDGLNRLLVNSVLFGDPLLINDGHVLMNRALLDAVVETQKSPLTHLLSKGFVKVVTRNDGNLGELAEKMADDGVPSAVRLLTENEYRSVIKPELTRWSALLGNDDRYFQPWSKKDTQYLYQALAKRASSKLIDADTPRAREYDVFVREFSGWNTLDPASQLSPKPTTDAGVKSRGSWQQRVDEARAAEKISPEAARDLLIAGHEAYNYQWGCLLADTQSVRLQAPRAELLPLLDKPINAVNTLARPKVEISVPRWALTRSRVEKLTKRDHWDLLDPLIDLGKDLGAEKSSFLSALSRYYVDANLSDDEMRTVTRSYERALRKHFRHRGAIDWSVKVAFLGASIGAGFIVPPAAGVLVPATVGMFAGQELVTRKASHLWRLGVGGASPTAVGPRGATAETAWFEVDATQARAHTRHLPEFDA